MRFKAAWAGALLAGAVMAAPAQAQINFQGYTRGCFFTSPTPPAVPADPACSGVTTQSYLGLTYSSSTFDANSNPADGIFTLGNLAPGNFNNLGSFTLIGGGQDYSGESFALFLTFTAPPGSSAGQYTATLTGNLTGASGGNLKVDFNNAPRTFTFSDGTTLNFSVADVNLNNSVAPYTSTVAVTGDGIVTPEPASVTLLATGLVGIFGAARRRRNKLAA